MSEFAPGDLLFGKYRVEELLGDGYSSEVYAVRHPTLGARQAIKILKSRHKDGDYAARTLQEGAELARMDHPNLVKVFDADYDEEGRVWMIMELVEGASLREVLQRRGALGLPYALRIGLDIASGLAEAHRNEVIHRDIKPENILLSKNGVAKICDFGIAKVLYGSVVATTDRSLRVLGTLSYMAPEQIDGERPTTAVDVHALGLTLWELCTGRHVFDELLHNRDLTVSAISNRLAPPPSTVRPSIPHYVDTLLGYLLEKNPEDRPAMKDVVVSLETALTYVHSDIQKGKIVEGPVSAWEASLRRKRSIIAPPPPYSTDSSSEEWSPARSLLEPRASARAPQHGTEPLNPVHLQTRGGDDGKRTPHQDAEHIRGTSATELSPQPAPVIARPGSGPPNGSRPRDGSRKAAEARVEIREPSEMPSPADGTTATSEGLAASSSLLGARARSLPQLALIMLGTAVAIGALGMAWLGWPRTGDSGEGPRTSPAASSLASEQEGAYDEPAGATAQELLPATPSDAARSKAPPPPPVSSEVGAQAASAEAASPVATPPSNPPSTSPGPATAGTSGLLPAPWPPPAASGSPTSKSTSTPPPAPPAAPASERPGGDAPLF